MVHHGRCSLLAQEPVSGTDPLLPSDSTRVHSITVINSLSRNFAVEFANFVIPEIAN